ncbi:MAG: SemiSWEET family sugar transporter [Ilumatobacteraceae bacterium]
MPVSSMLAVAAGSWGVLMSVSPILQIRSIVRARSSTGVSLGYLLVLFVGFVLWLSYGLALGNVALIVTNAVSILACGTTIVVARRYGARRAV